MRVLLILTFLFSMNDQRGLSPPNLVPSQSSDATKMRDNEKNRKEPKPNKNMFCLLYLKRKKNSLKTRRLPYGQED